jgi:peptidyl-prolyl cis-trans isomerase A (cyclophilin A)
MILALLIDYEVLSMLSAFNSRFLTINRFLGGVLVALSASITLPAQATIVQFQTNMGDFQVNLYDKAVPKTVENFLAYVNAGSYKNMVIHRAEADFVVQGGGFKYDKDSILVPITQNAAVINEPVYSNKRSTIAMAKLGGQPNSATNQWFFNLKDNSSVLDTDNSGYTVFGEVTGNGMAIIGAIAALNIVSTGAAPFTQQPMIKYTQTDYNNSVVPTIDNFVVVQNIIVLDAAVDTAVNLTPVKISSPMSGVDTSTGKKSGGGSFTWLALLLLIGMVGALKLRSQKSSIAS